ncbi:MinD/ParA family protein [Fibrobacterota bacterium]
MTEPGKKIVAIGGGKGGTGKSFLAVNLGTALSQKGKKVILADLNTQAPCLHTFLGVPVLERTFRDFIIDDNATLDAILTDNPLSDVLLMSGGADMPASSPLSHEQKHRFFSCLKALEYDTLFLDLPTGSSSETADMFLISNGGLVVFNHLPTTLEGTYLFIKNIVFRLISGFFKKEKNILHFLEEAFPPNSKLEMESLDQILHTLEKLDKTNAEHAYRALSAFKPSCILNNVVHERETDVVEPFQCLVKKYLGVDIQFLGVVSQGPEVNSSIENRLPLVLGDPECQVSCEIKAIAGKLE